MSRTRSVVGALVLVVGSLPPSAWTMPNFARKYNAECTMCHTTIPRLNEFGYQFRKAGFRTPDELGKETKTSFGDAFAARIQGRYDYRHRNDAGATANSSQITLHEVTLYPLSASFGKYYSSLMELSIAGEDFVEIENAYFRYVRGRVSSWFAGRIGIFHPFEGYGASDRPYSLSRPFLQTVAASRNGSTFFTPWNFDQAGVEAAYVHNRTSVSATLFNGLFVTNDEGSYKAFPAAGGELVKSAGFDKVNAKDVQLFVNQILKDDGSGVSAYYYHGNIDLPIPGTTPEDFGPSTSFGNAFDRGAVYGSYRVLPKLEVQGAYQWGQDHYFDAMTSSPGGTFSSQGFFGELDFPVFDHLTVGGRYDLFDPAKDVDDNRRKGLTAYANIPLNDGFQLITEYQHIQQERAAMSDLKNDNFQVRLIWIW